MEWSDRGVIIGRRPYGDAHAVVDLLTRDHGRHAGLVYGGAGRKQRALLEPGNIVRATWRARLSEQLGTYALEAEASRAALTFSDSLRLGALTSACALSREALPEREPHPAVFEALTVFLEHIDNDDIWPALYVRWELGLLSELGFGLDLRKCVATGAKGGLTHVSPRSGAAVSADAAQPYKDKLLPLPAFLTPEGGEADVVAVREGLDLTGFFLTTRVFDPANRALPDARLRLAEKLRERADVDKEGDET